MNALPRDQAPLHILLVEDDPVYQHLLAAWLQKGDEFTTDTANSLFQTRARLEASDFDAILLDLNLEDSSGLDTLEVIQSIAPSTPIVILTGMEDEAQGVEAVKAGAQEYLTKSGVGPEELKQELRFAVARARAEQDRLGTMGRDLERKLRDQLDAEKNRFYQTAARSLREPLSILREDIDRLRGELREHLSLDHVQMLKDMEGHLNHIEAVADDLAHVASLAPTTR